ncbi:ABC transporter substrate-binding protein [Mycetocola spongiae]|uniref:ABC transporter substrate-binding protein n=1 Tax=Mycetocola spongiae TaxID=2859226 RepID=UPI001CF2C67A|nr:ABC transporter substrate-binding protein [Mycetocola spongiae]UCR89939.1 ABC transporter substrate-binding protein [Mycetocola spongiae]
MTTLSLKLAATLSSLAAGALILSGCSAAPADAQSEAPMHEVASDFGTVSLPVNPQHAVGFYTTDVDILITLGIPLADRQPIRGVNGYETFPSFFDQDAIKNVTTFTNFPEYNFEEVLQADPDFILNGIGYEEDVVKRLPEIAPTYSIDAFAGTDWRIPFKKIAVALDREKEYQAWVDTYDARVAEIRAQLTERGIDPVVSPVSPMGDEINVSCYGVPCLVFADLGLRIEPLAEGQEGTTLSLEEVDQLSGIDFAFTTMTPQGLVKKEDPFAELAGNSLWEALPFVQNKAVHAHDLQMLFGSPSAHMAFLDEVEAALLG